MSVSKSVGNMVKATELIGKDIREVRTIMGEWWIIEGQHNWGDGMFYQFERTGKRFDVYTNKDNVVIRVFPDCLMFEN